MYNFNSVMWILDALLSPSVKRLKKIWKEVGPLTIDSIFEPDNEYRNYRISLIYATDPKINY